MGVEVMDMLCWTQHTSLFPQFLSELNCSLFLFAFPLFLCCLLEAFSEALDLPLRVQVYSISCAAGANAASWTTWQEKSWELDSWHHLSQNWKMLLSQTFKLLSGGLQILHPCPDYDSIGCVTTCSMLNCAGELKGQTISREVCHGCKRPCTIYFHWSNLKLPVTFVSELFFHMVARREDLL